MEFEVVIEREVGDCPVAPDSPAEMILLIRDGTVSGKMANGLLKEKLS